MNEVRRYFASFEMIFAGCLLVLLTVLLTVQIINRYILGTSFVWLEEIARISFVWMIYFSAAGAARDDRHIRVEIIDLFVGPTAIKWYHPHRGRARVRFSILSWSGSAFCSCGRPSSTATPRRSPTFPWA